MNAAIYARMSTDKQSADSPADQIARCREYAERQGWEVARVEQDAAKSGASRHNRPSLLRLFSAIDSWDVLLVWDVTRLGRDGEDQGWIRNQLRVGDRRGIDVSTGLDLENVGSKVMAVLGEEYIAKLRVDTHRGLRGRVERGFAAGAAPYGYRTVQTETGSRIVVEPEQAAVVRRIFQDYAQGHGVKAIAHALNGEGVSAPRPRAGRSRSWAPSSIREMLRNPLYRGELIWNRSRWVKDHATGRRRRIERPESEWLRAEDDAWRIVPDSLWAQVLERQQLRNRAMSTVDGRRIPKGETGGRPTHLLSGLLRCGECGGSFHALNGRGNHGCQWHRDRGPTVCGSDLLVPAADLEERILGAIERDVLKPDAVAYLAKQVIEKVRERLDHDGDRDRLAELDRQVRRLVDALALAPDVSELSERLRDLGAQRDTVRRRVANSEIVVTDFELRRRVDRKVDQWQEVLRGRPDAARRILRGFLGTDRLSVSRCRERGFRVHGTLRLDLSEQGRSEPPLPLETARVSTAWAVFFIGSGK